MQWNTDPTTQRIDCGAADLIDHLYENHLPEPCKASPSDVWARLCDAYPITLLPQDSPHYLRTALSVLETRYPEDADYLPDDAEQRLEAVRAHLPRLQLCCAEIANDGNAKALYDKQRQLFEQRAGRFGLAWKPMPIVVCMELRSGYCMATGSQMLSDQLTVWSGVSQEDIRDRTPELLAYLRAWHALYDTND